MPSARGTCGRFRARAPTNGPSRCLIVPSGLATRSPGARDSNAQIVPTSSDTRGVIGKTVNYFCPVMKGAENPLGLWSTDGLETPMRMGKPAPFVLAFVEAGDDASREHHPSHALSATQRAWLALCVTAILVPNSMGWARFERASLGTYALAALSWMCRHSKMPWEQ